MKKQPKIFILFICTIFLLIGCLILKDRIAMTKDAIHTTGIIQSVTPVTDSDGSTTYQLTIKYNSEKGEPAVLTPKSSTSSTHGNVGATVKIVYSLSNPNNGDIDNLFIIWAPPIIFILLPLIIGTVVIFVKPNK